MKGSSTPQDIYCVVPSECYRGRERRKEERERLEGRAEEGRKGQEGKEEKRGD